MFLNLEFWIEISKVIKDLPTLINLSERALEIQKDTFFHEPSFSQEMEILISQSQSSLGSNCRFKIFIMNDLLEKDPSSLFKICEEINSEESEITRNLWRYSGKILDRILELTELKDYYKQMDPCNLEVIDNSETNTYIEILEEVLANNQDSKFYVLISDRIQRALQDSTIISYISGTSERSLNQDLKKRLEFYLHIIKNPLETFTSLSRIIACCKIKEFLDLYIDFILYPEKYTDEVNITEQYTTLFNIEGISKTFEIYVLKKIKQLSKGTLAKLYSVAIKKKGINILKTIAENKAFNTACTVFPIIFIAKDQCSIIQSFFESYDSHQHQSYLKKIHGNPLLICAYSIEIINEIYKKHCQEIEVPIVLQNSFTNKSLHYICLGQHICGLVKEAIDNFTLLPMFSVDISRPGKSILTLIACFMMCIIFSFQESTLTKYLKIDCNDFSLTKVICRITNRSLEYLLASMRTELKNEDTRSDRYIYYKCSEKCPCLIEVRFEHVTLSHCHYCNRKLKEEEGDIQGKFIPHVQIGFRKPEALAYIEDLQKKFPPVKINVLYEYLDSEQYKNSKSLRKYFFDLMSLIAILFHRKLVNIPRNELKDLKELDIEDIDQFELKITEYIKKLQALIKLNLLCTDYYTWMLSFMNKLVESLCSDQMQINEFENAVDSRIILCSHYEMVASYKKGYFSLDKLQQSDEVTIEEIEEVSKPISECINLFRTKITPTEASFVRLFSLHPQKLMFPFIDLFLKYHKKIQILNCLFPIISFTNALLSKFSFQISRKQASGLQLVEFLSKDPNLEKKFKEFTRAWKALKIELVYDEIRLKPITFTDEHTLNYFLVDTNPNDKGIYMAAALLYLGNINNEILSCFAKPSQSSEAKNSLYLIQKLKEPDMLRFDFGMKQFLKRSWISNPEYSMGEELLYDFERIESALKNSLKKGKRLDLNKIECVQYNNEILSFYSKESGVVNEIRSKIKQEEINSHIKLEVMKFLERKDLKDIYNSMIKVLFFTQECKNPEGKAIEDVCQTIKFNLSPIFKSKNPLTSLPLKNIVHLNEILESTSFVILKESIRNEFTDACNHDQIKTSIETCLNKCKESPKIYPSTEEVKCAMMRFMVRYLTLEIEPQHLIVEYIGNTGFWKHSYEQKAKINEFLKVFPSYFTLADSLEVYDAIQDYITDADESNKISEQKPIERKSIKSIGKVPVQRGKKTKW